MRKVNQHKKCTPSVDSKDTYENRRKKTFRNLRQQQARTLKKIVTPKANKEFLINHNF